MSDLAIELDGVQIGQDDHFIELKTKILRGHDVKIVEFFTINTLFHR